MTIDTPMPEDRQDRAVTEPDLEAADAAEAPDIAEALADQLEAELDEIANTSGGDG